MQRCTLSHLVSTPFRLTFVSTFLNHPMRRHDLFAVASETFLGIGE